MKEKKPIHINLGDRKPAAKKCGSVKREAKERHRNSTQKLETNLA